jgi:hypothetical protein
MDDACSCPRVQAPASKHGAGNTTLVASPLVCKCLGFLGDRLWPASGGIVRFARNDRGDDWGGRGGAELRTTPGLSAEYAGMLGDPSAGAGNGDSRLRARWCPLMA